jgi:hypothetical protein
MRVETALLLGARLPGHFVSLWWSILQSDQIPAHRTQLECESRLEIRVA